MSPGSQLSTLPLQVPSLMSARSAFQRAHTASGERSEPEKPPVVEL
jgi:hypothetical protein